MKEKERRISLVEEFIHRLEGIKSDLIEDVNIIKIADKIDIFIEHFNEYIKNQKLNSNKSKVKNERKNRTN